MNPRIKEIFIYPIKSCGGIKLDKCAVTKLGIAHPDCLDVTDRKWLVVDEKGSFQTQRQLSKMALIKPGVSGEFLVLSAPGQEDLKVPIKPTETKIKCRVWQSWIEGFVYEENVGRWLSSFLGKENLQLVNFGDGELDKRQCKLLNENSNKARDEDFVIYQDYSPFMLISENSLNQLNSKLDNQVAIQNFRPNFFVENCDAFAEDTWINFKIGDVNFTRIKHCTRCLLTTVDQNTGVRSPDQEPLKTLKAFRTEKEMYGVSPMFGINLASNNEGQLSIGDSIVF